jgi:hypothetical protein
MTEPTKLNPVNHPGMLLTNSPLKNLYILFYRTGNNPRPLEKYFEIENPAGDMREIINKCKDYCDQTGFRFVKVERFLSNMEDDIRKVRTQQ